MAEFGENVRRLREECGLTQQSLAERLYVTRQAVSRWEGGSRYPDLMTAKQLAAVLGSSVDALLADEDMKQYVEKTPVLESPVSKGMQTAVLAFGLAGCLVTLLWFALGVLHAGPEMGWGESPIGVIQAIRTVLMAALFAYGTQAAIHDRLTPKVAAILGAVYFGSAALTEALAGAVRIEGTVIVAVEALFGGYIAWYFLRDRRQKPGIVYGICALEGAKQLVSVAFQIHTGFGLEADVGGILIIHTLVNAVSCLAALGLMCVMARALYRKRRCAAMKT